MKLRKRQIDEQSSANSSLIFVNLQFDLNYSRIVCTSSQNKEFIFDIAIIYVTFELLRCLAKARPKEFPISRSTFPDSYISKNIFH